MYFSPFLRRVVAVFAVFFLLSSCLLSPVSSAPIPSERVGSAALSARGVQAPLQLASIHSGLPISTPAAQIIVRRGFFKSIGNAFKKAGRAISNGVKKVAHGVKKAVHAVGHGIKRAAQAVGKGVKKAVHWVKKNGAAIAKVATKALSAAANVAAVIVKKIPVLQAAAPVLKGISAGANMVSNAIHAKLSKGWNKAMGVMDIVRDPAGALAKHGGVVGKLAGGVLGKVLLRREDGIWVRVDEGPDGALQERELDEGEIDAVMRARDAGVKLEIRDMFAEAQARRELEANKARDIDVDERELAEDVEGREIEDFDERELEFDARDLFDDEFDERDMDNGEDDLL